MDCCIPAVERQGSLNVTREVESVYSSRFDREVRVTRHARERMTQRGFSEHELLLLLEQGEVRYKDEQRAWIAMAFGNRDDNLVCAPVALEAMLVVKTVMHHFEWREQ